MLSFKEWLNEQYLDEEQRYSSKYTALNQVAQTFKKFDFSGYTVLDYGCGRGASKAFGQSKGYNVYLYDPYWGFDELNQFMNTEGAKVITCNNVLNVIEDLSDILKSISNIAKNSNAEKVIFKIYEGNGSGKGGVSKTVKGETSYQRNQKTKEYVSEVKPYFNTYKLTSKGEYIILEK